MFLSSWVQTYLSHLTDLSRRQEQLRSSSCSSFYIQLMDQQNDLVIHKEFMKVYLKTGLLVDVRNPEQIVGLPNHLCNTKDFIFFKSRENANIVGACVCKVTSEVIPKVLEPQDNFLTPPPFPCPNIAQCRGKGRGSTIYFFLQEVGVFLITNNIYELCHKMK